MVYRESICSNALHLVPNLTWRDHGKVQENRLDYVGDTETVSGLDYTNFSLLRHLAISQFEINPPKSIYCLEGEPRDVFLAPRSAGFPI